MCASAKKYGKIIFDATKSPTLARLMADCTSFWQNWLLFFCLESIYKWSSRMLVTLRNSDI